MAIAATSSLPPRTLSALVEASAAINSSLDLEQCLRAVARSAASVMQAEASSVLLLDRRRNKLVFKAAFGDRADALIDVEFDASMGIAGKVATTGEPYVEPDVSQSKYFFRGIDDKSSFQTRDIIAAPLIMQSEVIGVVEVLNRTGGQTFSEADFDLLQIFANLAATSCRNAQAHDSLRRENRGLREGLRHRESIIGNGESLRQVMELCTRVAGSNATVLLLGETGTGKELTARYLHASSPRHDRPFIAINCAALPETLLESELFGHEKGAFTGAVTQKLGRFELADSGTLFLDEIGEISQSIQVKLLRALQEREFVRVGGTKTVACDVRIIAATNRDLQARMKNGQFREDLYYRLSVFPIQIPPLRQRREDIPLLVDYFLKKSATELQASKPDVSNEVMALLTSYHWPGNIRELHNVIERAVLLTDGRELQPSDLPPEITGSAAAGLPGDPRRDGGLWGTEKALIVKALRENGWNQSRAARALGISRDNLRYRVKRYKIEKPS